MLTADGRTVWIHESGMVLVEEQPAARPKGHPAGHHTPEGGCGSNWTKLNRQLIDTSRQAGMAEVATGVLHNVGNVLNSVSVAATVVGDRLRGSKLAESAAAAALLREQLPELAAFLNCGPERGKSVAGILLHR